MKPGPVRFGTSGWRAVLGEGFTFERVRWVAAALARWAREDAPRGARPSVVVAHDTRFLADHAARTAARVLAGAGVRPRLSAGAAPTPAASRAVWLRRARAGLLVTASHNAPEYLGLKIVAPWGGAAPRELTDRLEAEIARLARRGAAPPEAATGRPVDLQGPYVDALLRRLDRRALRASGLTVHYDALHGTGAGVLDRVLERAGVKVVVTHADPDPRFGGAAPDPTPARLGPLRGALRRARGRRLGLATDGDADRFAVVDADGRLFGESEALALLVDHLARSGRLRGGVAVSVATGTLVERVAAEHGLAVTRHPIGFKHMTPELVEGRAEVAGEESGGFAWRPFARDKDGMLAGALLVELAATSGRPLGARLAELEGRLGRSVSGRRAWPLEPGSAPALAALRRTPPQRVGGARVAGVERADGLRVALADGFVFWRVSGTEPVLRIYAEAPGPRALAARFEAAHRLLRRAVPRR